LNISVTPEKAKDFDREFSNSERIDPAFNFNVLNFLPRGAKVCTIPRTTGRPTEHQIYNSI
jgi:hypothetical protein